MTNVPKFKNTIGVPVVKLQQQHKKFLGIPYSTCIDAVF